MNVKLLIAALTITASVLGQRTSAQQAPAQPATPAQPAAPAAAPAAAAAAASAQPPADPAAAAEAKNAADEATIRKNAQAYDDAWNARDAKKLAGLWSQDAIYSDPDTGEEIVGRTALEAYFTRTLEGNESKLQVDVTSVDFVSPNVAIERGVAHVISPGGEVEESTYSAVHVRQGEQWLLDRVTEEGVIKPPKSNYDHLKELEWMIGSWVDQDEDVTIQTDVEWTKNKNFITRSFSATIGDQVDMSGMQIIGWDPAQKRLRSWVFDSDGGFGEGKWKGKDGRWVIEYSGTLPDGAKMTGNNVMTYIDENSYGWESINRQVDGQILPNIDAVVIVRADALVDEPFEAAPVAAPAPGQNEAPATTPAAQ